MFKLVVIDRQKYQNTPKALRAYLKESNLDRLCAVQCPVLGIDEITIKIVQQRASLELFNIGMVAINPLGMVI